MTRTPTRSEVQRAWIMRQAELDEEAGKEPDALEYSREFVNFWKSEMSAAFEEGRKAGKQPTHQPNPYWNVRHNHVTREIRSYGKCPACDATRDAWKRAAEQEGAVE